VFIFEYARGWADLIVDQLAAARGSDNPFIWGYACLSIGRQFDPVIEEHYDEIDETTGDTLHVFSMMPPPLGLLDGKAVGKPGKAGTDPSRCRDSFSRFRNYPPSGQ
jgi:hypothetical protein